MLVGGQCWAFQWFSPGNTLPGGGDGGKIHRKTSWGPTFPGAQPGKDLKRKLQGSPKQSFEGVVVRKIFDVERPSDLLFPLRFVPSLVHSFVQILSLIC